METTKTIGIIALAVLLQGCVLAPDSIRPEVEHMSHVSQHFTSDHTYYSGHYGANTAEIVAHWDLPHAYIEVGEGIPLDKHWRAVGVEGYGEIEGPRDQFIARAGFIIPTK